MLKRFLFLILFLVCLFAQGQFSTQQFWLNYQVFQEDNAKLSVGGDVGFRDVWGNKTWNQFLIRPTVKLKLDDVLSLSFAAAYFNTSSEYISTLNEIRFHQEIKAKWPNGGAVQLFYRARAEQRLFYNDVSANEFRLRLRLLIGLQTRDFNLLNQAMYLKAMVEGFQTVDNFGFTELLVNQGRIHAALGWHQSNKWKFELHYIWQLSRLSVEDGLQVDQHVIRLRIFHHLPKK